MNTEMLSGNGSRSWSVSFSSISQIYISGICLCFRFNPPTRRNPPSSTSAKEKPHRETAQPIKNSYIFNNNRHQTQMIPYCHFPLFHSKKILTFRSFFLLKDSDALHAIIHRRASVDVVFRVLRQVYPENERTPEEEERGGTLDFLNTGLFCSEPGGRAFMLPERSR